MSRSGDCFDILVAESFFHSQKTEWVCHFTLHTRTLVFAYIESPESAFA
jgi:hypothetical protein